MLSLPSAFASARWARPAISFRPRERLGILEGPLAVGLIRPDTTAGDVFPIEVFARAAIGESNLIAAALRDGLVLDDLDAADHGLWFPALFKNERRVSVDLPPQLDVLRVSFDQGRRGGAIELCKPFQKPLLLWLQAPLDPAELRVSQVYGLGSLFQCVFGMLPPLS
jgi:hypothetical protein